jgi:uncharacterized membrane protein
MRGPARLPELDALRGFIMVVMALDHANGFVARAHSSGEFWSGAMPHYDGALAFFTRFVTHLCATGFFFSMGGGMTLFAESRRHLGWTEAAILRHFLFRGALLVLLNLTIENLAWVLGSTPVAARFHGASGGELGLSAPGASHGLRVACGVLTGLGLAMMAGGFLLRFGPGLVLTVSVGAILLTQTLTPDPGRGGVVYPIVARLLLIPGQTGPCLVLYPLIPWLGLVGIGQVFGRLLLDRPRRSFAACLPFGVALVALALLVRLGGGFGNIRLDEGPGWMAFLSFVKYPPSLVFLCWTLGLDLVLLSLFARMLADRAGEETIAGAWRPLLVFGRSPLFFYIAHLYLFATIGLLLGPQGIGIPRMLPFWLLGLVVLYPMCRRYERFKSARPPESLWRLF